MKKLMLDLDELKVDSFATDKQAALKGTVVGHYGPTHTEFGQASCDRSCLMSCNNVHTCLC